MNVKEALNTLGTTSNQVYRTLKAAGIKGKVNNVCDCPITNYLNTACKLTNENRVSVGQYHVYTVHGWPGMYYDLPGAVIDFIRAFDKGEKYQDIAKE